MKGFSFLQLLLNFFLQNRVFFHFFLDDCVHMGILIDEFVVSVSEVRVLVLGALCALL